MTPGTELAPPVQSILAAASERADGEHERAPLDVDARSFPDAVAQADRDGRVPVIAEVKPTSPTTDGTREDDPAELAAAMVEGGATAISALTEPTHFGGSPEALTQVREAVDVPVLRKDFVLEEASLDVVEADLVLLIARFVDDLAGLVAAASDRGFQPLVEVHDRAELETALDAGAEIVGVNNRDLAELEVDLATFESVAPAVPDDVTLIAESGISQPADVRRMREAGADAMLVGSAIMDHGGNGDGNGDGDGDVAANTRRLTQAQAETKADTRTSQT